MASGKKTMAAIQQQMEWAAGKPRAGAAVVAIRGEPETKQSSRAGKEEATGPENHNQRIIPTMEDSMRQPLLILFGRHPESVRPFGRGASSRSYLSLLRCCGRMMMDMSTYSWAAMEAQQK